MRFPRWAPPIALILTLAGVGVAIYLTIAHYDTGVSLACSSKGAINCEKVTSSAQSEVFGIPVAVLGLAYFVGMLPLQLPAAWRSADPRIHWGRLAYTAAGILFVFYLIYAEAVIIKAICLWCTAVHVLTLLLFVLTGFATALSYADDSPHSSQLDVDEAEGAER
ncbi:MAG TPA: vitamin K epoxide reductase family protein [Acidothermaceae bacterium]